MSNLLRSLIVRVGADIGDFQNKMKYISQDLKKTGKEITSAGSALTKGLTVPALAATAALGAVVGKALNSADEIQRLSDVTGLSAERVQELTYAGNNLGVEFDTIAGAQSKLVKSMVAARKGTGDQAKAFKALGISLKDSKGNMRSSNDVMAEALTKLHGVKNETDRNALSMLLFGKSAMDLNPIIKAGGDELNRLTKEARENGSVISNDNISAMDGFGDSLENMKSSLAGSVGSMVGSLIPTFEKLTPIIQNQIIPAIRNFIKGISDIIIRFSELSPGSQKFILSLVGIAVVAGPTLTVVGNLTTGLGKFAGSIGKAAKALSGGGGLVSALSALINPITLAIAGTIAFDAVLIYLYNHVPAVKTALDTMWKAVRYGAIQAISPLILVRDRIIDIINFTSRLAGKGNVITGVKSYGQIIKDIWSGPSDLGKDMNNAISKVIPIDDIKQKIKDVTDLFKSVPDDIKKTNSEIVKASEDAGITLGDSFYDGAKTGIDSLKTAVKELVDSIKQQTHTFANFAGLFDVFERKSISGTRLLNRLKAQIKAMSEWRNSLAILEKRGVSQQFLNDLRSQGAGAVDSINALAQMSNADLKNYTALYNQKSSIAGAEASKLISGEKKIQTNIEKQVNITVTGSKGDADAIANTIVKKLRLAGYHI